VVGDVHHLPFADGSLGGVLALNVFEHLADPARAAAELRRCLAPGSKVVIQTAFLQPLHADPYHFYNSTEVGIRRWFEHFRIDAVTVPANFNPVFAFSWLSSDLLWGSGEPAVLANATLAEVAQFWRSPAARRGPLWDAFQQLPEPTQRVLAAGFEMVATRPTSAEGTAT
jgi:SAM-dependent methyltransferase